MKKRVFFFALITCLFAGTRVMAQHWKWARNSSAGGVEGLAAATDSKNNIYAGVANISGVSSLTFGTVTVSNPGYYNNSILVKYDSAGNFLWLYATDRDAYVYGVTTDKSDNVYMFGQFHDTLTIGTTTLATAPYADNYFLAKFSPTGAPLWAVKGGGGCPGGVASYYAEAGGIQTDSGNNVYIAISFTDSVVSVGPYILHNDTTNFSEDILVAKYDSLGNVLWARRAGGKKNDDVRALTVTPKGGVYIAGTYLSPTWTFGATTLTGTSMLTYLAKFDPVGTPVWAESFTGGGYAAALACDSSSNVFLTGDVSGASLTIGSTTIANPTPTHSSCYLVKLDTSNAVVWYKTGSGPGPGPTGYGYDIRVYGLVVDACGNAWVEGSMGFRNAYVNIGGHVIDTPSLTSTVSGTSNPDPCFIAGFNSAGSYLVGGAIQKGGDDNNGFALGRNNSLYIVSEYDDGYLISGADTFYATGVTENYFLAKFSYDSVACFCISESINPGAPIVCQGDSIALFSPVGGGTWSSSGPSVASVGSSSGVLTGVSAGTAVVTYTQPGECYAVVTVTVNPAPPISGPTTVYVGSSITLTDAVSGGTWSSGNPAMATVGSSSGIVTGMAPGTVTIYYAAPGGCIASIVINVKSKAGISSPGEPNVELYPNPATNELYIVSETDAYNSLTITNTVGQAVLRQNITGTQAIVDVKALSAGMYCIHLWGENRNTIMIFAKK